jgi:AcrR family transcriptional regulator
MARPVDPALRQARRLQVVDAALTRFAADGYHATTTAAICREAGIGSGTLFHHFPSKASILVAVLETGTAETRAFFADHARDDDVDGDGDARAVLLGWVEHAAADLRDPRAAGFVRAVSAVTSVPDVAAALEAEEAAVRAGLVPWVARAVEQRTVRSDLAAERLARWLAALVDAYAALVAGGADADAELPVLLAAAEDLLDPR